MLSDRERERNRRYWALNSERRKREWKIWYAENGQRRNRARREALLKQKTVAKRSCPECKKVISPKRSLHAMYCSDLCLREHNRQNRRAYGRAQYQKHREQEVKRCRLWRKLHPKEASERSLRWRLRHPEHRQNPNERIKRGLRERVRKVLNGERKTASTLQLLGCSLEDFWLYLESKFESGMTRENYGKVWHVDHIVPCALFDLTKPEHQKRCFHFSNLQPLFAFDNWSKGARHPDLDRRQHCSLGSGLLLRRAWEILQKKAK